MLVAGTGSGPIHRRHNNHSNGHNNGLCSFSAHSAFPSSNILIASSTSNHSAIVKWYGSKPEVKPTLNRFGFWISLSQTWALIDFGACQKWLDPEFDLDQC